MAKRNYAKPRVHPLVQKLSLPLLAIAMFFAVCLSSTNTAKNSAVFFVVLAFVSGIAGFKRLRQRFTLPMMALALFVAIGGVSTFYAVAGKFALNEFIKLLIAFCMAVILLATIPGKDAVPAKRIASVLGGFTAIAGLVSIDMISTRILSGAVTGLLNVFSKDYTPEFTGLEVGTRILSIFQNPNVFGSIIGLGVLLSLGLVLTSENSRERTIYLVCLYVNALAFLLAFSMGAIAFIAVAFLVYLLLELPQRRARLFILMAETLVLTLISTALISLTSFEKWNGIRPLPLLCAVGGSALLCLTDKFIGQAISRKLADHGKLLFILISSALVAAAAFALLAYNLTGSVTLNPNEKLRRSAYPAPGEYTINAPADGDVNVIINYQNEQDTMMHTETTLYRGALSDAKFTVPEDSLVVYFTFSSKNGATIDSAECVGPETVTIPLQYKLLPSFIANRLQGLFANENAIQRVVFFEDGMKIFSRSPIIGRGLGSFENGIMSAQSFYYETKYAHNHYVQTLAETGVIGFVSFILLLVVSAAAVWFDRRKKDSCHPLTPALGAALVFIAGHTAMEVNFSYYAYLPIAFAVIALIALCCGASIPVPVLAKEKVKNYAVLSCAVLTAVFFYFLMENISAANLVDTKPSMETLVKAAESDKFEYADYMLTYIKASSSSNFSDNVEVQNQALEYAEQLSELESNSIALVLAEFYFNYYYKISKAGNDQCLRNAIHTIEKYLHYVASSDTAWNNAMNLMMTYRNLEAKMNPRNPNPEYEAGFKRIAEFYNEWNANNIGTITLSDSHKIILEAYGLERTADES